MKMQFGSIQRKLDGVDGKAVAGDLARVGAALQPQGFLLDADATDGPAALRLAARWIARSQGLNEVLVFDALQRREQAGATALGAGFAVPHARLPGIQRPTTLFMRLRKAVAFGAVDGLPVTCLLVIVVPRDGAEGDHLRMLSLMADLFTTRSFRKQIERAADAGMAEAAFREGIARSIRTFGAGRLLP